MKPTPSMRILIPLALAILLACNLNLPTAQADPNAFNTMVALTAQSRPTIPPAVTAPPALPPPPTVPPTIPPTQGPTMLVSASVSLPRHNGIDLDGQLIVGAVNSIKNAPANTDLVFYAPYANQPDWQFLYPVNKARMAFGGFAQASHADCVRAFSQGPVYGAGLALEAFPLDSSIFIADPGKYHCFLTDRGKLGALSLTAPGDYIGMASVSITYVIWDAALP